ncbi:MAG TPA: sigma-54-dependent Fis family transcriptional regulator [Burkholderiaceae bacterium]|nr:sigma-54-dependent Fis family transcriptional regulator [Burkholderiaceae bacterium]
MAMPHPVMAGRPAASGGSGDIISAAHARSARFGLEPQFRPTYERAGRGDLEDALERARLVRRHAQPVMESLLESLVDSSSMVILTDATGVILHATGDGDFVERASKVELAPGVSWAERNKGTNAIGTAIVEAAPTVVHADQHFLTANHFLTCSACPILDPHGDVAGVLDVTGDRQSYHKHTLALVKMSSRIIENQLFGDWYPDAVRVHFHSRPELVGTLMAGIAAFDPGGRFIAANSAATALLGLGTSALRAHTFTSLFHLPTAAILAHQRNTGRGPIAARTFSGADVFLRIEQRVLPRWVTPGFAPEPPPAGGAHAVTDVASISPRRSGAESRSRSAPLSSLHYLNTGDPQMQAVIAKVERVIGRDIPVMLIGETGTGKELLARAIHNDSPRAAQAFVAVNCASLPESLIESELFGYEEGAFTGARRRGNTGRIVAANGGTLFLDEIGDMPLALQARLLRVLQERVVTPLGAARSTPVDIALICATHRNLRELVARGEFREDLYYRLNGLAVRLPPLRSRSDISRIVEKILANERHGAGDRPYEVSDEVLELFQRYRWPGNFRQLANVLRAAIIAIDSENDVEIRREHLPDDFLEQVEDEQRAVTAANAGSTGSTGSTENAEAPDGAAVAAQGVAEPPTGSWRPGLSMAEIECASIERALKQYRGNVSAVARALGISRNTIYRRMPHLASQSKAPDRDRGATEG